jgi:N-acetylmuramoyl-L-alanine amidase
MKKTGAGSEIYSNSTADKLSNHCRLDVADEMTKMLSEQLAKEIDKEILRTLGIEPYRNKRRKNSINKIYR